MQDKQDKVLVITGGTRGIGKATVREFLDKGYRVVNISRSPSTLHGVTQISTDISQSDWIGSVDAAVRQAVAGAGRIVLIHNSATLLKDTVHSVDAAALTEVLQVNVVAAVQLNQLLLPLMPRGSAILYVGSTLAEKAVPGSCSYVTSKHAVVGLMRSTCQDLAGSGVHTACICPGFTDTEMLRTHLGGDQQVLQSVAAGTAYDRLIEPEEIAEVLGFCAERPVVNGAVIHANLGQLER